MIINEKMNNETMTLYIEALKLYDMKLLHAKMENN